MRAIHVGRLQIESINPPEACLIISITDPSYPPARIPMHPLIRAYHVVEPFHDIDTAITERFTIKKQREIDNAKAQFLGKPLPYILYDEARATAIAGFLRKYLCVDQAPTLIVTHCEAGISRSSAVTAAIQEHFGLEPKAWKTGIPNAHVYRLTLDALGRLTPTWSGS